MKKIAVLGFLLAALGAHAQGLKINQISFKSTNELQKDSAVIWLTNDRTFSLAIDGILLPDVYGQKPIQARFTMDSIPIGDSGRVVFYFQPQHNISHQFAPVIVLSNGESVVVDCSGLGVFSNTYYASTQNLSEEALKVELKSLLSKNYKEYSYSGARDEMYGSIDNKSGKVECVYTGRQASFSTRSGATSNNFNCEHTWPQSLFNQDLPMRSDIHHLFPTDETANSQRGNLAFGEVSGSGSWSSGGSKKSGSVFEPRDEHKGDCARAMMYFVLRYKDYDNFFKPQENLLRQWHRDHPPTNQSASRNEAIYQLQKNRNPFVDYPQLIDRIHLLAGTSVEPSRNGLVLDDSDVHFGNTGFPATGGIVVYKSVTNYGNTAITLSNFSFTTGQHSVLNNAGNDITIQPGKAVQLMIKVDDTQTSVNTTLQFETTDPQESNIEIRIIGEFEEGTATNQVLQSVVGVYPNPTQGAFHIDFEGNGVVTLLDARGRVMSLEPARNQGYVCPSCVTGLYSILFETSEMVMRKKLMILAD